MTIGITGTVVRPQIYIAGPLFSVSERDFDEQIAKVCDDAGWQTFLPHRDSGVAAIPENRVILFKGNVEAIRNSKILVANLDGPDVDSGTSWEIGYAYNMGIPIVGVRTDARPHELELPVNLMIHESVHLVRSLEELRSLLKKLFTI
jgi:nucleoside 2-deoxyribosyltransferase